MTTLVLLAAANLLLNPSFEDWPDGEAVPRHWLTTDRKTAPDVIAKVQALGTDGENCISFRNGGMGNFIWQKVKVTPGKYYNLTVDAKTDIVMYGFWLMPSWQDANGRRIPNANRGSGVNHMSVKTPWGQVAVKNYLAPTNAAYLVMNMGPNDSWSHNGVPGMIWVDNACVTESASVVEDAPVVVKPTDALTVLGSELGPKYDKAGLHVRAGARGVTAKLVADEPIEGGKAVVGAEKTFTLAAGEERSVFTDVETVTAKMRLSVWIGADCVWRRHFKGDETFLRVGLRDRYDVRKSEIFVPNDARWYVNFPIEHTLKVKKGNVNHVFGNPTNLNARLFVEVPEGIEITSVKYSDWGGDLPVKKPLASERIVKNGKPLVRYELPTFISGVNHPLVFFRSSLKAGIQARGSIYLTWDGGAQVPRELTFTTVSYGRFKPFERLQLRMDNMTPNLAAALSDDPAHELPSYGVNALAVPLMTTEKTDRSLVEFVRKAQASGRTWYFYIPNECCIGSWANEIKWRGGNVAGLSADPSAAFTGRDGKPEKNMFGQVPPCPSYRGTNFLATARFFLDAPAVKDFGVTWLVCDWECWGPRPCYCERCRRIFRETWCKANGHPDYGDPREFMADEKANAKAAEAWRAFYAWMRGQLYADFKKELDKGLDPARTTWWSPIPGRFSMSEWTRPRTGLLSGVDVFDWPFGYKTPDAVLPQIEEVFSGDLEGRTGQYTCSVCPMQGCELCERYPVISTYYNLLESAALGVRGFEWYYAPICESMTWKYVMDGLREMRPFEDIVLDGKVTVRGEGRGCSWRRIVKGGEALFCVRDYLLKEPKTVELDMKVKHDASVWECATWWKIADLKPGENVIRVQLDPDHLAKLLYVGTKFDERQQEAK